MSGHENRITVVMLSALEALYLTRKTTLAAHRLGIAQPSVSVYLRQLREITGDPLFVRTAAGLEPTDYCNSFYLQAKEILNSIDLLASRSAGEFDPSRSAATFSAAISIIRGRMLFEALSLDLVAKYPLLGIDMLYMAEDEALRHITTGQIDVFVGIISEKLDKHFSSDRLLTTDLIVVCSDKSPFYKKGKIGKEDYLDTPHIKAATSFEPSILDEKFKRSGLLQRRLVSVPEIEAEIKMLRKTDYLLVIDRHDFELVKNQGNFRILKTDFKIPQFDLHCVWHARKNDDPAHRWYRDHISRVCKLS